jgi:phosphatidylserine decarboxylase
MVTYRYPYIAREGWPVIAFVFTLALLLSINHIVIVALLCWVLCVVVIMMYRDPLRRTPASPLAIVAPVDGKVISLDTRYDPYTKREALHIVIKMSILDVFSIHSLSEGKVMQQWHGTKSGMQTGQGLSKNSFAQWLQTDEKDDVVISVNQHYPFQHSRCYLQSGERVGQGQRFGIIPLGATIDVYLPINSKVDIQVGQAVIAGTTIISTLVH